MMTTSKIQPQLGSPVGASPLSGSEEQREFLQTRLTLLGKVGTLIIGCYIVLTNLTGLALGGGSLVELLTENGNLISLVNLTACAAVWSTGTRRSLSHRSLRLFDVGLLLFFCSMVALNLWLKKAVHDAFFQSLLHVVYAVMARAVIVPARTLRTAWISVSGFMPMFIVAVFVQRDPRLVPSEILDRSDLALYFISGLIGAALATVVAHVIFGLQVQIRKAMQLGQYQLEEKIGQGGMGEVYRATHAMLRRPTAVKLLRPDMAGEKSIARFEREVQLTSRLTHPNTIAVYDYGRTPEGIFYYAMELLVGLDLEQLVERHGPQCPGRVIHILRQVCSSLVEAHGVGLIHRDIKPPNIILCERGHVHDVAKVVDFGLVKHVEPVADKSASDAYALTGTPLYMSPEALREPERIDARSDLYAVGAVGYFLLTGKNLFDAETVMEACTLQLEKVPDTPSARVGKTLPADLEAAIMQCLEKDREIRPQDAAELRQRLKACADADTWDDEAANAWWTEHGLSPRQRDGEGPRPTVELSRSDPFGNKETIALESNER